MAKTNERCVHGNETCKCFESSGLSLPNLCSCDRRHHTAAVLEVKGIKTNLAERGGVLPWRTQDRWHRRCMARMRQAQACHLSQQRMLTKSEPSTKAEYYRRLPDRSHQVPQSTMHWDALLNSSPFFSGSWVAIENEGPSGPSGTSYSPGPGPLPVKLSFAKFDKTPPKESNHDPKKPKVDPRPS